jgi:hypothetical protein
MKMDLRKKEWGGSNWIDLTQDKDGWRAFVDSLVNLLVP